MSNDAVVSGGVRKVVINACFGGFSLSPAAVRRIAEMEGRPCFFFVNERADGRVDFYHWTPVTEAEAAEAFTWTAFDVPNPNDVLPGEDGAYERHALNDRDIPRDDPKLIAVVEELGDAANGSCAKLRIVEIPADAEWTIEEYDGNEHIAETHRTWR